MILIESITVSNQTIERLAVLPFTNLTNDPEQEHLVQGMHGGVMRELAQGGCLVIARTSVLQCRNAETPIRDIARELNIDAVIEASDPRFDSMIRRIGAIPPID